MTYINRRNALIAVAAAPFIAALSAGFAAAQNSAASNSASASSSKTEIAYGTTSSQRLDIYPQPGLTGAPMLLFVHGGAFTLFDKSDVNALPDFAQRHGFLLASTNFEEGDAEQAAKDVAAAAAWMVTKGPDYGGDPKRLFLMGHSSGGNTVALVAIDPRFMEPTGRSVADIAGVIGVDGAGYNAAAQIHSSLGLLLKPLELAMWVKAFGSDIAKLSPTLLVQKDGHYPPFLLFNTDGGLSYNTDLQKRLQEAGSEVTVIDARHKNHLSIDSDMGRVGDPEGNRVANFIMTGHP